MVTGIRSEAQEQRYLVEFTDIKAATTAYDELMMKGYTVYPSVRQDRLIMSVNAYKTLKKGKGNIKVIGSSVDMMLR